MSTTAPTPSPSTPAPWRPLFLSHLDKLDSPEFVLSTLEPTDPEHPSKSPYLPRARYCIYRGMFGSLPPNKHNTAPRNPSVFDSDLLTFTSDVRMQKIPSLFASGKGKGVPEQSTGSGGGGPVESVFWIKDVGTQWRIRGDAWVIGPDIDSSDDSGVRTVKSVLGPRMRVEEGMEEKKSEWSWERELAAHFGNLSPGMRGSFKGPAPGRPVANGSGGLNLGEQVKGLDDEEARKNFRVVVIRPVEVEQLDLSVPDKARRWRWVYVGEDGEAGDMKKVGEWKMEELWP